MNLLDFIQGASNSAASNVSAPVDGLAWLLRKAGLPIPSNPVGGSDWMAQKGFTREPENKNAGLLGEAVGGVLPIFAAAKAPQIAASLLRGGENLAAPQLNKQAGAVFVYPQDEALATAQRNAAKPVSEGGLGLGPKNTPMERAKAMGFDTEAFHETSGKTAANLNSFDPRLSKSSASDFETPYAVFTKPDGRGIGLGGEDVAQMPLYVHKGKQATYRDRGAFVDHMMYDPELNSAVSGMKRLDSQGAKQMEAMDSEIDRLRALGRKNPDAAIASKNLEQFISDFEADFNTKSAGVKDLLTQKLQNGGLGNFDSVRIANDAGSFGRKVDNTMILNPANVRSRFAAFDPARRNEADILGRADPELLKLISGGLLGYGGYNALKD